MLPISNPARKQFTKPLIGPVSLAPGSFTASNPKIEPAHSNAESIGPPSAPPRAQAATPHATPAPKIAKPAIAKRAFIIPPEKYCFCNLCLFYWIFCRTSIFAKYDINKQAVNLLQCKNDWLIRPPDNCVANAGRATNNQAYQPVYQSSHPYDKATGSDAAFPARPVRSGS